MLTSAGIRARSLTRLNGCSVVGRGWFVAWHAVRPLWVANGWKPDGRRPRV